MKRGTRLDLCEALTPRFSDLLFRMERKGVWVKTAELERILAEATADQEKFQSELDSFILNEAKPRGEDWSWNYSKDVAWFVYRFLGLPPVPTNALPPKLRDKKDPSGKECLDYLRLHFPERRHELDTLRSFRRAGKAIDYASKLLRLSFPVPGEPGLRVLHPCYGTYSDGSVRGRDKSATATGRLSVSNPPLQQIPRDKKKDPYRLRRAFVAPPGKKICVVDLSQLEVRIQAHLHIVLFQDETLANLCKESDFHAVIAREAFGSMWPDWRSKVTGESFLEIEPEHFKGHKDPVVPWARDKEKELFYGLGYGKSDESFGSTMWDLQGNPLGRDFAAKFRGSVYARVPALAKYPEWVKERVANYGGMHSLLGRWRPVTRDNRGVRQALNQVPQGGGSEVAQIWMLLCDRAGLDLRSQIHDELHVYCAEDDAEFTVDEVIRLARETGERLELSCPLDAEGKAADCWEQTK